LPAALFVTEPTSQNSHVFPRAGLKNTSAPQAITPKASKIGRAARFWGILGTARSKSLQRARALATS
jgi:hypothetical protein